MEEPVIAAQWGVTRSRMKYRYRDTSNMSIFQIFVSEEFFHYTVAIGSNIALYIHEICSR